MRYVQTAEEFAELLPRLKPGEKIVYHVGHLAVDAKKNMRLLRLADMARRLSVMLLPSGNNSLEIGMSYCTLTKRKRSEGVWEYIAIRLADKTGG